MSTIGQWVGRWFGDWFGASEVDPNAMRGSATIGFTATGTLTAGNDGSMVGSADFALAATGTLTNGSAVVVHMPAAMSGGGRARALQTDDTMRRAMLKSRIQQDDEDILAIVAAFVRVIQ